MSTHPPHLLDSNDRPTNAPVAFIPFCAYSGHFARLSAPLGNKDFYVCNKFQPTFLEGQLCYNLNVSSFVSIDPKKTEPGKQDGIFFAIDLNDVNLHGNKVERDDGKHMYSKSLNGHQPQIYINTLSRISDTRAGLYVMTVMKKMTGTESFLALPDKTKGCQLEPQDECEKRMYAEEARKQCG